MKQVWRLPEPFRLESGRELRGVEVAWHEYGPADAPVTWVCHALTASSDVQDWWPGTVELGGLLDPANRRVICANILGSCYGTTGPLSVNPETGEPWYGDFPAFTIHDLMRLHLLLADHLGVKEIELLVGSSVGGFQALEWAVEQPERIRRLWLIATAPYASPWAIAIDETQRMAIRADATWGERRPDAASAGLAAARALGLLSYRGGPGYNLTQKGRNPDGSHRAVTYQRHQGDKLVARYNAYTYMAILDAFDTHDVGRGRGGLVAALGRITAETLLVGITTDIIFPPSEIQEWGRHIPGAVYREIDSQYGHDGFLVETGKLQHIIENL